jgi:hypothetical protein
MEAGLMTLAPFSETSSTTPKPVRSAANHRCKPIRANEQANGAGTRKRGCRLNSAVISTPSSEIFHPIELRLQGYVTHAAASNNFPQAAT